MGYHVIDPENVENAVDRPSEMHDISDSIGLNNIGLRFYVVSPGEQMPLHGMHYHDEQEEAFFVTEGELNIETPDREYVINKGEFFIAEPGSPHRAFNSKESSENATVVAIGAPKVDDGHKY